MDISIDGLNQRQRLIADVLWQMDTAQQVESFISSLHGDSQKEARVVMILMTWAMLDTVTETDLAEQALEQFK